MPIIIQYINRLIGYGILLLLSFFLFKIPSPPLLAFSVILIFLYILTSSHIRYIYILSCFAIPLVMGIFIPLKQLNKYPSVAVFYAAFTWTTLFTLLLLFFNKEDIKKNNRPDNHKKN